MDRKLVFLIIGGVYWGLAVPAISILAPIFLTSLWGKIAFFAGNFLLAGVSLIFIARITARTRHDMLLPVVIMSLAAMFMDAISLAFIPAIYPADPTLRFLVAASLLFFFWSFLFFALLWHRPKVH